MFKYFSISAVIIVIDQLSKIWMVSWLSLYQSVPVLPHFNLTMAHNYGAAFSFLADAGGWQRWFFIGLTVTISLILVIWLSRLKPSAKLEALSLSLILGGAIGNVIDRIAYGYVIDFLDLYLDSYHWPTFNIADSAICIGAFLIIFDSFKGEPKSA